MIGKLAEQEIEEILKDNIWGHLGCNDGFNTYVYPINFLYDGQYIICQSQHGAKIETMRQNNRVCFQIDEVENHSNWRSVMVHGTFLELTDERDRYNAIKSFVDRRMQLKVSDHTVQTPGISEQLIHESKPVIFRIVIDEKHGRYENA